MTRYSKKRSACTLGSRLALSVPQITTGIVRAVRSRRTMKKTTKKLHLNRLTIANLTASTLEQVVGGDQAMYIGIQSVKVTTRIEPCQ